MDNHFEAPVVRPLANGLTLRTVSTPTELDRVAELSAGIHEPTVGEMTRKIFTHHPHVTGRDLVFIENQEGDVVSTICLIPWTLRMNGVNLPAAELGIVGTLEHYRKQGLNRILMEYYWQRFQERGALLSIIQGIPYFYRQYSYEYAMLPLEGGWRIQPDQIPDPISAELTTRPATAKDIPTLMRLLEQQSACVDLSAERSVAVWQFLLQRTAQPEAMQHDTYLFEDRSGAAVAYVRIPDYHFYENLLTVDDAACPEFNAGLEIFHFMKSLAQQRNKEGIRLALAANHPLMQMARSFSAADLGVYSWQISIPDRAALLYRMAGVFEQRLEHSLFTGLTGNFSLNLYREVIGLEFESGKLIGVNPSHEDSRTILNIPPNQFIPLVMGGRTIEEIRVHFPDAHPRGPWQLLVNTLFPSVRAFLANIY